MPQPRLREQDTPSVDIEQARGVATDHAREPPSTIHYKDQVLTLQELENGMRIHAPYANNGDDVAMIPTTTAMRDLPSTLEYKDQGRDLSSIMPQTTSSTSTYLPSTLEYKDQGREFSSIMPQVAPQITGRELPSTLEYKDQGRDLSSISPQVAPQITGRELPSTLEYKDQGRDLSSITPQVAPEIIGRELPSTLEYKDQGRPLDSIMPIHQATPHASPRPLASKGACARPICSKPTPTPAPANEPPPPTSQVPRNRKKIACCGIITLAVLTIAIVLGLAVSGRFDAARGHSEEEEELPTFSPQPSSFECFKSRGELIAAVDKYVLDPTQVAVRYGSEIGEWCVGSVANFSEVFSADRNPQMQGFNMDISGWNMSSAVSLRSMFEDAMAFNQDLCRWVDYLDPMADASNAFTNTACPRAERPVNLSDTYPGPLCTSCAPFTLSPTTSHPPTAAPTPTPKCFSSNSELQQAVDDYLQDPSGGLTAQVYGHPIGSWCVGSVTNFFNVFSTFRNPRVATFNEDISAWDTSNARRVMHMFLGAAEFDQDLSTWDVSRVTDFEGMFVLCTSFNSDISHWNVSSAVWMNFMFVGATSFDQDIGGWDVGNVVDFSYMFFDSRRFNADLSSWDVGSGTKFDQMFYMTSSFTSDLRAWNTSQATSLQGTFGFATSFNADLSSWDVSQVKDTSYMFTGTPSFNRDLSLWDVGNVDDMSYMFLGSFDLNQDLCSWGTRIGSGTVVNGMFEGTNCDEESDPNLNATPPGPFCSPC